MTPTCSAAGCNRPGRMYDADGWWCLMHGMDRARIPEGNDPSTDPAPVVNRHSPTDLRAC